MVVTEPWDAGGLTVQCLVIYGAISRSKPRAGEETCITTLGRSRAGQQLASAGSPMRSTMTDLRLCRCGFRFATRYFKFKCALATYPVMIPGLDPYHARRRFFLSTAIECTYEDKVLETGWQSSAQGQRTDRDDNRKEAPLRTDTAEEETPFSRYRQSSGRVMDISRIPRSSFRLSLRLV